MIIQQIRNAAVKVKYSGIVFLTDPWLRRKGTGPSLEACRPDMEKVCKEAPEAVVITSHLDSVKHAQFTSDDVKRFIKEKNLAQVLVPANGEKITV